MKLFRKIALLAFLPSCCFALEEDPWFSQLCEFVFRADYNYQFYSKIDHGSRSLDGTRHVHVVGGELELTIPETWNWQVELEFADTKPESFGYRSFALQVRKLWWDDVCGDPVSVATGFVYRDASSRLLKAQSTPYHARANFELNTAIGKEWDYSCYWAFRVYALGAIGQANKGAPWLRGDLVLSANYLDCHQWRLYAKSYFGLGSKETVSIDHFNGWANIHHQSVDVGGSYRFLMGMYGSFRFDYFHRVYAHSYPEHLNSFIVTYEIPSSVL